MLLHVLLGESTSTNHVHGFCRTVAHEAWPSAPPSSLLPSGDLDLWRRARLSFDVGGDEAAEGGDAGSTGSPALSSAARALLQHESGFKTSMIGTAHLNAFVCFAAASLSSLSFFSFCVGGVPVRLEALESSPALAMLLGPRGFRVFDPRELNMEDGPSVSAPVVDACRDPARPNRRRSSIPTTFFG